MVPRPVCSALGLDPGSATCLLGGREEVLSPHRASVCLGAMRPWLLGYERLTRAGGSARGCAIGRQVPTVGACAGQGGPTVRVGASALRCHRRGPRSDAHEGVSCLCLCRRGGRAPPLRAPSWASMGVAACSALLCDDSWCLRTLPHVPEHTGPTEKPVTPFQLLPLDRLPLGPSDTFGLSR